ncbi:hypothetical protein [Methylobacterium indicum]|uniref:hypothetical protein n=1 Tax=Methylobacterium indicum TaxID=1775910 RepID=UPI000F77EA99|nr:hypothetical protein [Methylobacterium indicum]
MTNISKQNVEVKVGIKDGAAQQEVIRPGETKLVNCASDDPWLLALLNANAVTTEDKRVAKAVEAAAAPSA